MYLYPCYNYDWSLYLIFFRRLTLSCHVLILGVLNKRKGEKDTGKEKGKRTERKKGQKKEQNKYRIKQRKTKEEERKENKTEEKKQKGCYTPIWSVGRQCMSIITLMRLL